MAAGSAAARQRGNLTKKLTSYKRQVQNDKTSCKQLRILATQCFGFVDMILVVIVFIGIVVIIFIIIVFIDIVGAVH